MSRKSNSRRSGSRAESHTWCVRRLLKEATVVPEASRNFEKDGPRHWLVKFAPFRTSWLEIVRRGTFTLRGVRSPVARKHLAAMRRGDRVLFYHSQQERAVMGVMEVVREAYPDPTSSNPRWLTCDFTPKQTLVRPVQLAEIKTTPGLADIPLVRQPRLAVMPLDSRSYSWIIEIGGF